MIGSDDGPMIGSDDGPMIGSDDGKVTYYSMGKVFHPLCIGKSPIQLFHYKIIPLSFVHPSERKTFGVYWDEAEIREGLLELKISYKSVVFEGEFICFL
jgi:hypothetical protein